MLGLILIIVLLWQVYKAANESGRNGVLWAIIAFFGSVALQVTIGLACGLAIGIGIELWGWSPELLTSMSWPISILTIIINALAIWLLIKYLSRVPDDGVYSPPPPPPPTFN